MTQKIDKRIIGDNIYFLAKYYGFSIKDIEEEAGVSQGYISRLRKKNSSDSNSVVDLLITASEKFHVSIDSLFSLDFEKITDPVGQRLYLFFSTVLNMSNRGLLKWERNLEDDVCDGEDIIAGFVCHYNEKISFYIFQLDNLEEEVPGYTFFIRNGDAPVSQIVRKNLPGPVLYESLRQLFEIATSDSEFVSVDASADLAIRFFMNENSLYLNSPDDSTKYRPLYEYLLQRKDGDLIMTFSDIEDIIGSELPISARKYSAFWGNNKNGEHPYCKSWLDAGFKTVDVPKNIIEERVRFVRIKE